MDDAEPGIRPAQITYPFEVGTRRAYDLDAPCLFIPYFTKLQCGREDGYIEVRPYNSTYHYSLFCGEGHAVKHVKHAEVELRLNLPRTQPEKRAVRDILDPPRRVAFNVLMRDYNACVYCGRGPNDLDTAGKPIVIGADHIVPRKHIDIDSLRLDRDLLRFARDVQLVTACNPHNSAKSGDLLNRDLLEALFIRRVLQGDTTGTNAGLLQRFRTLYRLAERNVTSQRNQAQ